jgi:hypothetical protein
MKTFKKAPPELMITMLARAGRKGKRSRALLRSLSSSSNDMQARI